MTADTTYWRLLALTSLAGFALLATFVAAPELDLMAAAAFFDGAGFGFRADEVALARRGYTAAFWVLCVLAALGLVQRLALRRHTTTPLAIWLFAAAVPALGPGLLVNAVLKENWGRARPDALALFGGDARFTLPFEISDACMTNCSFTSGEGSSAAAVLVVVVGLFGHRLSGWVLRPLLVLAGAAWLTGAALLRMLPGKHFLSDTLFAFILVALIGFALYAMLGLGRKRAQVGVRDLLADILAGPRLAISRQQPREP